MQTTRRIRSFVMRAGRMTEAQQRGWETGFPRFGLRIADGKIDWDRVFDKPGRRVIEIGFGMGDSLATMAAADEATQFVGIEVHRPGVGRLMSVAMERGLTNLKVYAEDAVDVLQRCVDDTSIDGIHIYFPDPWHKKRHHKRRLIQAAFVSLITQKLRPSGVLHLATDWSPYAEQMLEVLRAEPRLKNTAPDGAFCPRPGYRPETKFERRGARLGHGVWDIVFTKTA